MSREIWKPVNGYEGLYEVSNLGRVRSLPKTVRCDEKRSYFMPSRIMRQTMRRYPLVGLVRDGKQTSCTVHSLMCIAFYGPRPKGHCVRHLDGDIKNNRLSNLRWGTYVENNADQVRHGTRIMGERHPLAIATNAIVKEIRRRWNGGESQSSIARDMPLSRRQVCDIARGKRWSHVGLDVR